MARVLIIGGGIAGLSVALERSRAGDEVSLLEADTGWGGQLRTERDGEYVIEHGAEGFVANSQAMEELARELGIHAQLVGQLTLNSFGFDGQSLKPLAPGEAAQFLGFRVPSRDLGKGIRAFSRGMSEVVEALVAALVARVDLRAGERAQRLTRSGAEWHVATAKTTVVADRVVVATGARAAASLLEPEFGAAARELARAEALSSVTVSLAYPRATIAHPLDGTGFVVAEAAQLEGFRACTFTSSKFARRAPQGMALLRAFFRPNEADLAVATDAEWTLRAERAIASALAPSARSERAWVARWSAALPVNDAVHQARVAALEAALAGSNIALAGAAFHGSGIDGALCSARRAATQSA